MKPMSLNTYWRLKSPEDYCSIVRYAALAKGGYKRYTKYAAPYLVRIQKGLLCYSKCTTDELRKFAKDRGAHEHPQKTGRAALITALSTADESITFHRFLDLPPELRNNVYELYFADFSVLITPSQPPLTKTSHQIRDEALSTFYAYCSFQVKLLDNIPNQWTFSVHSLSFLDHLRAADVGRLSNLSFTLMGRNVIEIAKDKADKYTIALKEPSFIKGYNPRSRYPGAQKRLDDYLQETKLSTGEKKLEIGDIWKIRDILEQRD